MLNLVVFYILAGLAGLSAIVLLVARNTRHCVILFLVFLLATSGILLQLQSRILFAAQLLLLAGAMLAIFFSTIQQIDVSGTLRDLRFARRIWMALAIGIAAGGDAGLLYWSIRRQPVARLLALGATQVQRLEPTARVVLHAMVNPYVLSLEITSVLLLTTAVALVAVNRKRA